MDDSEHGPLRISQSETLRAAIDCIIPADDWPSASENHVLEFIEKILETDLRDQAGAFERGLDALNDVAMRIAGADFARLDFDRQNHLLMTIERSPDLSDWFAMLVRLTNEGYYADPSNGGNLERISWKMIGYDPRLPKETR